MPENKIKTYSIIAAGFGGQGVQFIGKQLALTGMYLDKKVSCIPSYGAEMRGGTSNCTVIISDGDMGSPVTDNPDILIAMNLPSYLKFHKTIAKDGCLICNSSLVSEKSEREDINKYYIPATDLSYEHNVPMNVIMLGKLISATGIFTFDEFAASLEKSLPESKKRLLDMNIKALKLGFDYADSE
ncbi:MAG: 2-oxoacid:acceptor oxidoreductase family protein [Oscillospiraceae bacterium]|nr:2-oxoacid:acceptor oxidoreductase family protein [Oscillospiraceae bacterium]